MWLSLVRQSKHYRLRTQQRVARFIPRIELLETRTVLSAAVPSAPYLATAVEAPDPSLVNKMIVAGDPNGSPADSPANRVDSNTTTSPYSGVGSLFMDLGTGSGFLCSGTLISPTHVLTAGHCVDADDDGANDFAPSNVSFVLNYGSDLSNIITASAVYTHPDFTGFANPSVLDDLAIIELSSAVPAGVPIYAVSADPFVNVETVTLVGYGTTGDGVSGYDSGSASFNVKRVGQNHADVFLSDDEGTGAREGFEWDFDGDHKKTNVFGRPNGFNQTLGNDVETTVGGGDSGGPSFFDNGNGYLTLFGVNTFTTSGKASAPYFGSVGGGIVVSAYTSWIDSVIGGVNQSPTANAGADQNIVTGSVVQLDGSYSSDPEGDPLSFSWTLSVPVGSSATLSDGSVVDPTFTADVDGAYVATLVVNDGTSDSSPDSATVTVGPVAASMHVGDIDGSAPEKGKSGKWSANATVTIHDDNENPVAGATVTGQWSGDASGTEVGVTDSLGNVSFSTGNLNGGTSATFTVTDVSGALSYSSGANHDPDGDSTGTSITLLKGTSAVGPLRLASLGATSAAQLVHHPVFASLQFSAAASGAATGFQPATWDRLSSAITGPWDSQDTAAAGRSFAGHAVHLGASLGSPKTALPAHAVDSVLARHESFGATDELLDDLTPDVDSNALLDLLADAAAGDLWVF